MAKTFEEELSEQRIQAEEAIRRTTSAMRQRDSRYRSSLSTETQTSEKETELERIVNRTPFMLTRCSGDLRYQFVSQAYAEMLGKSPDEIAGRPIVEVMGDKGFQTIRPHVESVLRGETVEYEDEVHFQGVGPRLLHVIYVPDTDEQANVIGWIASIVDITEHKRADEARRLSEHRERERAAELETVLDSIPTPVFIVHDPSGAHITGNRAANLLLRNAPGAEVSLSAPAEAKPRHFRATKDGRELRTDELPAQRAARGEAVQDFEFNIAFDDGTVRNVIGYGAPLQDAQGRPRGAVHVLIDITERKRSELQLAAAKADAEEANRAKDQFLAVLSHELRTPLTPIMLGVSTLRDRVGLDPAVRETLEMIRRSVEMEARLIDDLLDVSRIARGKIEPYKQRVKLATVIDRAVEVCRADLEAGELQFDLDIGAASTCWVEADAVRLQQVFWNLLKNAIKFTPRGGRIGVYCRLDGDHVVTEVSDSGIGIEADAMTRIFRAFEQEQRWTTGQFGGLGLGLAISEALIEMHGGTIEAHSDGRGKGATFRIRLPQASVGARAEAGETGAAQPAAVSALRILLVEDHPVTARMLEMALRADGHSVQSVGNVGAALELAERMEFDLLLSDLGLPDGSGHDLMRQLRQRGCSLPGIALTGFGQEGDIRRSAEAGFASHLTKPASREAIQSAIAAIMSRSQTPPNSP
jgi:two-component system CheB/CheR fusion protein